MPITPPPDSLPKRILSLDGGGIKGALTLGYLQRIEDILRKKYDNPKLLLCDYFHLIGGTSTGSIIATALAMGMSVSEITEKYKALGSKIFSRHKWYNVLDYLVAMYDHCPLENELKNTFGDLTLGSSELKTGLCIVAKRIDTNSTWFLINHPDGKYYNFNKDIKLWQAVRSSTAAPTYFKPQMIDVGNKEEAAFVDGGVSLSNNPALGLLMVATLKGFPYKWALGEENILLVSVGTGFTMKKDIASSYLKKKQHYWALNLHDTFMEDATWQNQAMLQWISNSPTAIDIDSEVGKLENDLIAGKPLIKYLRYNFCFSKDQLESIFPKEKFDAKKIKNLSKMDKAGNCDKLYEIGKKTSGQIKISDF